MTSKLQEKKGAWGGFFLNVDMFLYSHFPNDVRPRKEAVILKSKGHKVRVFCLRAPGEKRIDFYSESIEVRRVIDATNDSRISPIKLLFFWIAIICTWSRRNGHTAIHAHDLSALPAGFVIALLNRLQLVYDSHELFPEAARDRYGTIVYFVFFVLEVICCLRVTALIGVSEAQIRILQHRCRCTAIYLNNYPSLFEIEYSYHEHIDGPIVFGMSGYLFRTRGHEEVMNALELMADDGIDIEFWIVGDGPEMSRLKEKASSMSYPCRFFGYIDSRKVMWDIVSRFDYAIVANLPSRNYMVTSINRTYEYAALGVPFVSPHYTGVSDILVELNLPNFTPLDPNSIRHALEILMKCHRRSLSTKGRQLIKTQFNWEVTSKKLEHLYYLLSNS